MPWIICTAELTASDDAAPALHDLPDLVSTAALMASPYAALLHRLTSPEAPDLIRNTVLMACGYATVLLHHLTSSESFDLVCAAVLLASVYATSLRRLTSSM